ncbi:CU044_2847 family protein [Phormidium tenue]|uniref:Trypsin-co-occurring domain-containing protein n=1 Tax=Phormidium tenue NIES-30 TaxID=549789 RepID=A0A1U7IZ21_9CYAN|nr:CU044_2847 family protein [Phormidium tenue]MBD2234591.1 hypothetical protein [Phormidium tenue FACHB-1052]OKH44217.1 hypothetical protein NIES30_23255 [Phormidium tenue NIES-30]
MSNFIPIDVEGDQFYIEVLPTEDQTGIKQRSRDSLAEKLTKDDFKRIIRQAVMPACETFVDVWQELNQPLTAESAEVEFNLGFTASGSAVIVQASGQASFKVKICWKFDQVPFGFKDSLSLEGIGDRDPNPYILSEGVGGEDPNPLIRPKGVGGGDPDPIIRPKPEG